jgi:hypothetical protein
MSNPTPEIWERFYQLPISDDGSALNAIQCDDSNNQLLIKGSGGEPILLVRALPREHPRAPIRLKHVSITFDLTCEVRDSKDGLSIGNFTQFRCSSASSNLHRYFVDILIAATVSGLEPPTESQVDECVNAVLDLFRRFSVPPRTTVVGLWGELAVILASKRINLFVKAWHNNLCETFDFCLDDVRLEVKTSEKKIREHDFSLHQVQSPRKDDFVASLLVNRSASGVSVFELLDMICEGLSPSYREKVTCIVLETLGEDAEIAEGDRFDLLSAMQSLCFLSSSLVPSPSVSAQFSEVITNVRFRANISESCRLFGSQNFPK